MAACGIAIDSASGNTIGGTAAGARNVISGNACGGLVINNAPASGNLVQGNFIGTDVTGTVPSATGSWASRAKDRATRSAARRPAPATSSRATSGMASSSSASAPRGNLVQGNFIGTDVTGTAALGNSGFGVMFNQGSGNTIGGTAAGAGNVISGNVSGGLDITGAPASGNLVQGNLIGTDVTGTAALGNGGEGIEIDVPSNTIGGTAAGAGNVISANTGNGVLIFNATATGNLVQGNAIGTDVTGTGPLGNALAGVAVVGNATGNAILTNTIFGNARLGIDLGADGVTPNDPGDPDTGANNLQNFPVLTSATSFGGTTTVQGTLNSRPGSTPGSGGVYRIEFFASNAADPSGFGQGQFFLGFTNVTTDASGNASFTFTTPTPAAGQVITATATSIDSDQGVNNTSEFSAVIQPVSAISISINNVTAPEGDSGTTPFTFTVSLSAPGLVPVTVDYASADGTAVAGRDYIPVAGTLTFAHRPDEVNDHRLGHRRHPRRAGQDVHGQPQQPAQRGDPQRPGRGHHP